MRQRIQQIRIDHSITLAIIICVVILFSAFQLTAQEKKENNKVTNPAKIEDQNSPQVNGDKIEFKNENNAAIITITDEGSNRGSITLPEMATSPAATTDKLYNLNGTLTFGGTTLGSGGANQIDDLTDARTLGNSVFLGAGAGSNDDGSDNKNYALGLNSLFSTTSGYSNLGLGYNSLYFNTIGIQNIGLGQGALYYNTEGSGNVAVGYHSNHHNQTGSNNTILGHNAGRGTSTHNKSGNVFIGYEAGYNETGSNKLYIENSSSASPLIYGDFGINQVKINGNLEFTGNLINNGILQKDDWDDDGSSLTMYSPSRNVGIGTPNPTEKLEVDGNTKITGTTQLGSQGVPFSEIKLITGSLSTTETFTIIQYPTGYTQDNTFILSCKVGPPTGSGKIWQNMGKFEPGSDNRSLYASLNETEIVLYYTHSSSTPKNYKIVLMKID
jgi:hypothetical protein